MSDNNPLIMICGESSTGKSASFRDIQNQDRWVYANTEAGKPIPFRHKFKHVKISNSGLAIDCIRAANASENVDGIILDSLTFLLDMVHLELGQDEDVVGFEKWNLYDQYIKSLFLQGIGSLNKPLFVTAHTKDTIVEGSGKLVSVIPVKGQNKNIGLEAYCTLIVHSKKIPIEKLKEYDLGSPLLNITEKDVRRGYKYVFQTRSTSDSMHERMRSPLDFFDDLSEVYIDNNVQLIVERWDEYYETNYSGKFPQHDQQ